MEKDAVESFVCGTANTNKDTIIRKIIPYMNQYNPREHMLSEDIMDRMPGRKVDKQEEV